MDLVSQLLALLGEDPSREGLLETPRRVADSLLGLTEGYAKTVSGVVNGATFQTRNENLVLLKNIEIFSLCEHHLLPFFGTCHIGYVPKGKILGVSKMVRIANIFARRLQVQEGLTDQISEGVLEATGAKGVGVVIHARHLCMMMRGVENQNSQLTTTSMRGVVETNPTLRNEFFSLLGQST